MRRVLKYPLHLVDESTVDSFEYFKPLSVQVQGGVPCLWAEVDDDGWPREWSDLELEAWKTIPNSGNAYMTKANVYRSEAREQLRTALKEYDL